MSLQLQQLFPSFFLSLQPEEYGQEAMEGQGEAMLDPEGEAYDETQQVISRYDTQNIHVSAHRHVISEQIDFCEFGEKPVNVSVQT